MLSTAELALDHLPRLTLWQFSDRILLCAAYALLDALLQLAETLCELAARPAEIDPLDAVAQLARQALQVGSEIPAGQ